MMKIDIFSHILPIKYKEALVKLAKPGFFQQNVIEATPTLFDLERRFKIMDKYEGLMQVLTLALPPVEEIADSQKALELAKLANDEMAELVSKFPDRFPAAVACIPMNNVDGALEEIDRAINTLKFRGVQIFTPFDGKPIDSPELMPIYEKMSRYNLPILIHPKRPVSHADYPTETKSMYQVFMVLGWPYETSIALCRLVFSGILEKFPNLKFVTHHCGGMIPYFAHRIMTAYDRAEMVLGDKSKQALTMPPIDYFKKFYNDTAISGSTPSLMCARAFCGAEHLLFGTDMPYDSEHGNRYTREIINSIVDMDIPDSEKKLIFEDNARSLFRLPL